ncbi:TraR/DksA C4-type zinc finger protein [candidate division WOR-3 bacterium]|nr:TraR/DksA C4-type zinc finger protein [candidate division WOR-3 bacterium]
MDQKNHYRAEIEEMIAADDLKGLLAKAGELHGHFCNYLAYGVVAGLYGIKKLGVANTGMEEVVAIIETNNCFSDGVQMVTGCSFGNNALVYRDYGKTAVTLSKRDGKAVRLALDPDFDDSRAMEYPEAYELFDRYVIRREQGSPEVFSRMMGLFHRMSVNDLSVPAERMFRITEFNLDLPEYAPIFDSVRCEKCGENVIGSRIVERDGKSYCIPCAQGSFAELNGTGIIKA